MQRDWDEYNTVLTGRSYEYQYCKENVLDYKRAFVTYCRRPEKIASAPDVAMLFKVGDVQCKTRQSP